MKGLKKLITSITLAATLCSSAGALNAGCHDECGCGYEDCCTAPCISPALALGAVAVIAAIAVLVHNNNSSSSHSHGHSS